VAALRDGGTAPDEWFGPRGEADLTDEELSAERFEFDGHWEKANT
jgi:hypothetical protein